MYGAAERSGEFQTMLEVADALREEFGADIDAHAGSEKVEAGQINRAFRVAANCILRTIVASEGELPGLLTWVLRGVAERRLVEAGVKGSQAMLLLDLEPDLNDAWLAYVALAPASVIRDLMEEQGFE